MSSMNIKKPENLKQIIVFPLLLFIHFVFKYFLFYFLLKPVTEMEQRLPSLNHNNKDGIPMNFDRHFISGE